MQNGQEKPVKHISKAEQEETKRWAQQQAQKYLWNDKALEE